MIEILILLFLIGSFVYGTLYFRKNNKDEEGNDKEEFDIVFITSIVLLCTAFVFGILFSDRVIKFLMSVSQLASIGLLLNKIKSYFVGGNNPQSETKVIKMTGGGQAQDDMPRHNDIYDEDDLPESDDEEDY